MFIHTILVGTSVSVTIPSLFHSFTIASIFSRSISEVLYGFDTTSWLLSSILIEIKSVHPNSSIHNAKQSLNLLINSNSFSLSVTEIVGPH